MLWSILYLLQIKIMTKDMDMMQFWRDNRQILPKLFRVARRVLCSPASSAASERVLALLDDC